MLNKAKKLKGYALHSLGREIRQHWTTQEANATGYESLVYWRFTMGS